MHGLADNFHSQFVSWAKVILPLSALALLSTLFLFARPPGQNPDLPLGRLEGMARDQQISSPRISGVTQSGAQVQLSAAHARPNPNQSDALIVDELSLTLDAPEGLGVDIRAGRGQIDARSRVAELDGLARLTTSNGYTMETIGLTADLNMGEITSHGALEIHAPFGQLTAGQVKITLSETAQGQQMLFTQGVKLIYTPQSEKE